MTAAIIVIMFKALQTCVQAGIFSVFSFQFSHKEFVGQITRGITFAAILFYGNFRRFIEQTAKSGWWEFWGWSSSVTRWLIIFVECQIWLIVYFVVKIVTYLKKSKEISYKCRRFRKSPRAYCISENRKTKPAKTFSHNNCYLQKTGSNKQKSLEVVLYDTHEIHYNFNNEKTVNFQSASTSLTNCFFRHFSRREDSLRNGIFS